MIYAGFKLLDPTHEQLTNIASWQQAIFRCQSFYPTINLRWRRRGRD